MICQRDNCKSERILDIHAHSSDRNIVLLQGKEKNGYLPRIAGICGGDDVQVRICLDCGQVQGNFPIKESDVRGI